MYFHYPVLVHEIFSTGVDKDTAKPGKSPSPVSTGTSRQPELSNWGITLTSHINSRISARNSLLWNAHHMLLFPHTSPLRVPEVLFWVNHILNISKNTDFFCTPSGFQSSTLLPAFGRQHRVLLWTLSLSLCPVYEHCAEHSAIRLSSRTFVSPFSERAYCCRPLSPRSSPFPTRVPHFVSRHFSIPLY